MDSRVVVEIDAELKKEAQIKALQNDTSLKNIITDALKMYLKEPEESDKDETIEIN